MKQRLVAIILALASSGARAQSIARSNEPGGVAVAPTPPTMCLLRAGTLILYTARIEQAPLDNVFKREAL